MMRQLSIFIENEQGRLNELASLLGDSGIDIYALTLADTKNYGILRCIVNDPDRAVAVVNENGYTANVTEVLGVCVKDEPGGLAHVVNILSEAKVDIEYLYSFVKNPTRDSALIIFRVEDVCAAAKLLEDKGVKTFDEQGVDEL